MMRRRRWHENYKHKNCKSSRVTELHHSTTSSILLWPLIVMLKMCSMVMYCLGYWTCDPVSSPFCKCVAAYISPVVFDVVQPLHIRSTSWLFTVTVSVSKDMIYLLVTCAAQIKKDILTSVSIRAAHIHINCTVSLTIDKVLQMSKLHFISFLVTRLPLLVFKCQQILY